jgi:D-glycerate 3-kinase
VRDSLSDRRQPAVTGAEATRLPASVRAAVAAGFAGGAAAAGFEAATDTTLPALWRACAGELAAHFAAAPATGAPRCQLLGVSGGQGAGKSTLSAALVQAFAAAGLNAATLSLDDVYMTRAQRQALAREIHPLLATRGVPGTHDLSLLTSVLAGLRAEQVRLPRFDKGADDRQPEAAWAVIDGPLDVLIFEGWCVGVPPQSAEQLMAPVNTLEALEDPEGSYRRYVNDRIALDYVPLWAQLDAWLHLQVPDRASVLNWRRQQEQALPAAQRMDDEGLARFVAHYHRLTDWLREQGPKRATWSLELGLDHNFTGLQAGSERVQPPPVE